jgi:hypothetical protein
MAASPVLNTARCSGMGRGTLTMKPPAGDRLGRQARGEKVPSAFTVISHSMPSGASTMVYGFGIVSTSRRKGRDIRKSNRGAWKPSAFRPLTPYGEEGTTAGSSHAFASLFGNLLFPARLPPATWGHSIRRDRAY